MTTSSTPSSPEPDRRARLALGVLLAACFPLYLWGIGWGLPSGHGWAPDEVVPSAVAQAAARRFSGGWHDKYPAGHFMALAAVQSLVTGEHARFLAGRALSVAFALGTLALLYACASRAAGRAAAPWAAAVFAFSPPFVYYAKTSNVEAHYLFWTAAALLCAVRALERHRARDYAALGACAAASVAVKDQAYGMWVLSVPALLAALSRQRAVVEGRPGGLRVLFDRRVWTAAGAGAAVFAALTNLVANPGGFAAHVRLITGAASQDFRMFPGTPAGQAALLAETVRHLAFVLGGPALLAAAIGIAGAAARWRDEARLLSLLVPAASYVVFFLCVVSYVYDRFLLPLALVLAVFAGRALARLAARPAAAGRAAAAAVVAFSLARAASVDVLLSRDARYAAEDWLRAHVPGGAAVAAVGPLEYLPRLDGLAWRRLAASSRRVSTARPEFVVVNADYAARADPHTPDAAFYAGMEDGTLGYDRVFGYRFAPRFFPLPLRSLQSQHAGKLYSNLDKVNPEIRVYRRRGR